MGRKVGFYNSWMNLGLGDLGKLDLDAFNSGMTIQKKVSLTLALFLFSSVVFVFLEPIAGGVIFLTGFWAIWNPNNQITKLEKKIFITAVDLSIFFALVDTISWFLNAAGIFAILVILHLVYVWRR